jgi:type IV secretory pathway VirB10-like protein
MAHSALSSRSRLLLAPALTLAVAAPLVVTSTASACWCPTGMHESAPGSETCVADTPKPETITPPATTETPAPVAETPAPAPAPAPAPTPVVTASTPVAETPVAAEEEQGEVLGETVTSKPRKKAAKKTTAAAPTTAVASAPVEASAAGQLPFTGLDTGLVAVMGASMLGGGIFLRRRTQPNA